MTPPPPSRAFLEAQLRWAMGRGIPAQVAEDAVFAAWEAAASTWDPARGAFEPYLQRIARNRCAMWWRETARAERAATALQLVPPPLDAAREEQAARRQAALLDALTPEQRAVFAAWALQKHLGKGRITSVDVSRTLGMETSEYENAKRRLRGHLQKLLDRFGWSIPTLLYGDDDADATG